MADAAQQPPDAESLPAGDRHRAQCFSQLPHHVVSLLKAFHKLSKVLIRFAIQQLQRSCYDALMDLL